MSFSNDTIQAFSKQGDGYALLYELGVGLGADVSQLLSLKVEDIADRDHLTMYVGPKRCRRTFALSEKLRKAIASYIEGRDGMLFIDSSGTPLTESGVMKSLKACGIDRTFLEIMMGRYYRLTNDIFYPMFFLDLPTVEAAMKLVGGNE